MSIVKTGALFAALWVLTSVAFRRRAPSPAGPAGRGHVGARRLGCGAHLCAQRSRRVLHAWLPPCARPVFPDGRVAPPGKRDARRAARTRARKSGAGRGRAVAYAGPAPRRRSFPRRLSGRHHRRAASLCRRGERISGYEAAAAGIRCARAHQGGRAAMDRGRHDRGGQAARLRAVLRHRRYLELARARYLPRGRAARRLRRHQAVFRRSLPQRAV